MKTSRLLSYVRRAVDDYQMIEKNDKIAVGISGGKDSLSLLIALAGLRRFYPHPFALEAITVSVGFEGMDFTPVKKLCQELDVPYTIVDTDIAPIVFEERKEKNPCSLCSKMRKGALNDKAKALGCNKVALGHNQDDVIETFFLSLFYEGRIHTFSPKMYMDRKQVYTIRPLIYAPECEIRSYIRKHGIEIVSNRCKVDGYTKRQEIKQFIKEKSKEYSHLDTKIFSAIQNSHIDGWDKT